MIRPITPNDTGALLALTEATGLFEPNELEEITAILADYFASGRDSDQFWITSTDDDEPVGVAYCIPEQMTDGAWNLLLIAIHPTRQGQGHGTVLIRQVEETVMSRGGRILLVETSASLDKTRAFYRKCGYDEEACIRDYYKAGDDKIIYRKALTAQR